MIPSSIRGRLPLSYAAIALLATLALSFLLISTLQVYFRQNEAYYLKQNAEALGNRLAPLIADAGEAEAWKSQIGGFAFLLQARVRILDPQREVVVDSGLPGQLYLDLIIPSSELPGNADAEPYLVLKRQPFDLGVEHAPKPAVPAVPAVPNTISAYGDPPAPPPPPPAPLPSTDLLLGFVIGPEATRNGQRSDQQIVTPILDPQTRRPLGFVELSAGPTYGSELLERAALVIVVASVLATAVAAVAGWWVSRRRTTPLLALTSATAAMAAGNLAIRADTKRRDEIGALAQAFNTMAQRIEETVTTLRRFVADAAHELNTPLTALRTHLELALDDASPREQAQFVEQARGDVERLEQLANDLLDLSRMEAAPSNEPMPPLDLAALIRELEELYSSAAEQKNVQLAVQMPEAVAEICGDTGQVRRALINVLENALKFTPAGGSIRVSLQVEPRAVCVEVQDTGIGIPPADLPHVFSRFHRARNTGAYPGSGLGLAIVKAIMLRHGGDVAAASNGHGTCFTFRWPPAAAQLPALVDDPRE